MSVTVLRSTTEGSTFYSSGRKTRLRQVRVLIFFLSLPIYIDFQSGQYCPQFSYAASYMH